MRVWRESGVQGAGRRFLAWALSAITRRCDRAVRALISPSSMAGLTSGDATRLLSRNRDLEGRYRGKRCFVLATGPSTLAQNLSPLRGECIIALNEMFLRTKRDALKPAVLMVQDLEYFSDGPGYRRFLADLESAAHDSGAEVMFPVSGHRMLNERGLFQDNPPRFFLPVGRLINYPAAADVPPLDFSGAIPGMPTVTHSAIALALFLGFSEIYLLGVDLDFIAHPALPIRHGYGDNPYNENDHEPAAALFERKMGWDYPRLLAEVADHLRCYARLREIAEARGQRLYNANPGGLLETLERRRLETLF